MGEALTTHAQQPAGDWRHSQSAVRHAGSHARLWILAGASVAGDLWTKHWAFATLEVGRPRPGIPRLLDFQLSLNPGALFGLGSGLEVLFIVASVAALCFVLYLFAGTDRTQWVVHAALALILAGAMGNLYDRAFVQYDMVRLNATATAPARTFIGEVMDDGDAGVISLRPWSAPGKVIRYLRSDLDGSVRRVGVVRDFLKFTPQVGGRALWPWVFNLADAFLVVGVSLLLLSYWSRGRRLRRQDAAGGESAIP